MDDHVQAQIRASAYALAALARRPMTAVRAAFAIGVATAATGCSMFPMLPQGQFESTPMPPPAAQWVAPVPKDEKSVKLAAWWHQFDDPALLELINAAEVASPSIASAKSRIEQARATRVAAGAALLPSLNAQASASRGQQDPTVPLGTATSIGLQANWEIDLFGANRAGRDAAQARLEGADASWHDARVAVAAEVATTYVALRACEAQVGQARIDASSRAETARLTLLSMKSGFESRANESLARGGAARAQANAVQQQQQCDVDVKILVALTAMAESDLRTRLAARSATIPMPASIEVSSVPAEALAQRPDIYNAERAVIAASADLDQSNAQRFPRVSLAGNVGVAKFDSNVYTQNGTIWHIGPIAVTLPIFDGGTRRANVDAARARYDEAAALYAAALRAAVREVESALVVLQSTRDRTADANTAVGGFNESYLAVEALYKSGLGSLFELEESRRNALLAQNALIELNRERVAAWITLYRALGGGWSADNPAELAMLSDPLPADARVAATDATRLVSRSATSSPAGSEPTAPTPHP